MKKTTIALAALAFSGAVLAGGPDPMVAPAPAAQDTMYLGFHADMSQNWYTATAGESSSAMTFNQGGFQFGMLFGAIRAEVSADLGTTAYSTASNTDLSAFVKGAYDLKLGHGLAVYPVAGIGLVHTFKSGAKEAKTNFAWLVGAGTSLALNDKTSISGEYNYVSVNADDGSFGATGGKDFGKNVFSIRLNRTF